MNYKNTECQISLTDRLLRYRDGALKRLLGSKLDLRHDAGLGINSTVSPILNERISIKQRVSIKAVGGQQYSQGVLVSLSRGGAACVSSASLKSEEQVWITFRLKVAEAPICLLSEVVWKRCSNSNDSYFGLRFLEVAAKEKERIIDYIAERIGLDAGKPRLPLYANTAATDLASGKPWVSAVVGVLLGLGIASISSALLMQEVALESFPEGISEVVLSGRIGGDSTLVPAGELVDGRIKKKQGVRQERSQESFRPIPTRNTNHASYTAVGEYATRVEGNAIVPTGLSDNLLLDLRTITPVDKYKSFWLSNPRRMVVDVLSNRSAFHHLSYYVEHRLVKLLRVGKYRNKVRFVIETSNDATGDVHLLNGKILVALTAK